jgi:hypothetical protein
MFRRSGAIAILLLSCTSHGGADAEPPGAPVQSGTFSGWPEATAHLRVSLDPTALDLVPATPPGMSAFWSIASTKGAGSGFFYSVGDSRVAYASAQRVQDIRDASALDYGADSIGPVAPGGIIVVRHAPSRRYFAFVVDAIDPVDPRNAGAGPYAYADIHWFLTSEGSADFTAAGTP